MPSIALLAAGLALAGAPAVSAVPLGSGTLPLEASMEVVTATHAHRIGLAFQPAADGRLVAVGRNGEWEATVELAPAPGGARAVTARVRWLTRAEVERIALSLAWPGAPAAVDRALRFSPVQGPLRIERGTPLLLAAGPALLAGGPGLAAARVERAGGRVRATLFLDDAASRPFSTFTTCFPRLPAPEQGQQLAWGSFDPRRDRPFAPRAPGTEDRLEAAFFPLARGAPFLPVVVERWPRGARAAVVFTDHADRTDAEALRAVLWGDADPAVSVHVRSGFLGRGVALTRSFFVHGPGSLDDPEVAALADDLARGGAEVALHSITAERDGRAAVRRGLADAARWVPGVWIDHQPYTNCEAISAEGWRAAAPFGVRDVLAEGGVRWVWAAGDAGPGLPRIHNLLGGRNDEALAAIAPFALDGRLWTFRSSLFYASADALAGALSDAELDRLEDARGLFVAHTYLGPSARTTRSAEHLGRLLVRPAGGRLVIDPAFDAALARVADRVQAGLLASLTWSAAGDRLRALGDVEVAYLPDGGVEVRNRGGTDLDGLTLAIPVPPEVDLTLDGGAPLAREDDAAGARVWLDLPAGGRAVLHAAERFLPLPFLPFR